MTDELDPLADDPVQRAMVQLVYGAVADMLEDRPDKSLTIPLDDGRHVLVTLVEADARTLTEGT